MRPRFRHDHLIAELVEEQDARFVDVMDPDSGRMFRFYEVEYSLACGMDGERDVAGIVKWAQEELGLSPSASEVQAVISTLKGLQFIDTTAEDGKVAKAASTRPTAPSAPVAAPVAVAPAAAASRGDELAPGVVVGKPTAPASRGIDLELGQSGPVAAAASQIDELPSADFDLGAPGAATVVSASPTAADDEFMLGASGASPEPVTSKAAQSEVSIDLSEHLSIKPDDVKEAVRASKVMQAVEIPKDLMDALEPEAKAPAPEPVKQVAKQPEPIVERAAEKKPVEKPIEKVAAKAPVEKAAEKKPAEKAAEKPAAKVEKAAEKKPVELPKQPEKTEPAVVPPATKSGPNAALVIFLILVVVGAGAFFVWKFVINKPEQAPPAPSSKVVPPPAPTPPPPPEVTGAIKVEAPAPTELKAAAAGAVETIEPADKDVKAGDTIAWLAGAKALQTEIEKLTKDVERLQPAVTAAEAKLSDEQQKENNESGVKSAQRKLDAAKKPLEAKKSALTQKQGELDKLAVKATSDGKLAEPVAAGTKVEAGALIAKIAQPSSPTVAFKLPAGVKLAADGTANVAGSGAPVACKVVDAQAETVKVSCPADPTLADGATVKLVIPGAASPAASPAAAAAAAPAP
ncbi:MAG: hypothetical protein SFX73_34205 [Kofleriaceae bacterium]|nr:hypothetical protein [Kofleriaceae bacterium]